MRRVIDRQFLGKINGFESKDEKNFEKKHFKAYKRGFRYFTHGKRPDGTPIVHETKENLIYNTPVELEIKQQ